MRFRMVILGRESCQECLGSGRTLQQGPAPGGNPHHVLHTVACSVCRGTGDHPRVTLLPTLDGSR